MASQFSFAGDDDFCKNNIRTSSELETLRLLRRLGLVLRAILLVGSQRPNAFGSSRKDAYASEGPNQSSRSAWRIQRGVDVRGGVTASFYNSFLTEHQQWMHLSGSKGYIQLNDFVLPYHSAEVEAFVSKHHFHINNNCVFNMEPHTQRVATREYAAGESNSQEVNMIRTFSNWSLKESRRSMANVDSEDTESARRLFQSASKDGQAVSL